MRGKSESDKLRKLITNPSFISTKMFDNDLVAVHSHVTNLKLYKPIYVGQSILDLSNLLMYNFYYRHLKELYKEDIQLLYTDTDSLLFNVKTENVYEDMKLNKKVYDFSNYPEKHELHSIENKADVGRFKDETTGNPIWEFVGLRPKNVSFYNSQRSKRI